MILNEWLFFHIGVLALLFFDLGIIHRDLHTIRLKEAVGWSVFWISLGLAFGVYIYYSRGADRAFEYYSAYLVEESLSVDNLFIFAVLFGTFHIDRIHQHRLLFWGILGAIVLRATMILAGAELIAHYHGILYFFGAVLVLTGIKFLFGRGKVRYDPSKSRIYLAAKRFLPITEIPHTGRFTLYDPAKKRRAFTLYFLALLMIEGTDMIFAIDSVPAVLAISRDPFVVYTSNICAILGLRSLFFVLENLLHRFVYLSHALGFILLYVGGKMLLEKWVSVPDWINLCVIVGILLVAIAFSYRRERRLPPT